MSGWDSEHRQVGAASKVYALILNRYGQVGFVITLSNGTAQWLWSDDKIQLDCWSHVSGVFDGTSMQIYINGMVSGRINFAYQEMMPTDDQTACPQAHVRRSMHKRTIGIEPSLIGAWHVGEGGNRTVMDVTIGHEDLVVAGHTVNRSPIVSVGKSWDGVVDRIGDFYFGFSFVERVSHGLFLTPCLLESTCSLTFKNILTTQVLQWAEQSTYQ